MRPKDNTIKVFVPRNHLSEVVEIIRNSGAKHWPFIAHWNGHVIELEDHPVATYLKLKYGKF